MKTVLCVIGTRPEAIKMAPVVWALKQQPEITAEVLVTAQHRELLDQMLPFLELDPVEDLDLMQPGQGLAQITARVVTSMDEVLARREPDLVLVQGDTTTVMATALAALYRDVPLGHVEAGLRTGDLRFPFPEEANRTLAGRLTRLHFAPTERARDNLLREGVSADWIHVTGNTVIDALLWTRSRVAPHPLLEQVEGPVILVTAHRRENFGAPLREVFEALREIPERIPGARVIYPVHPNPNVKTPAEEMLGNAPGVSLIEPQGYPQFVSLLAGCDLVLTDSGGVQEEAPSLDKPVLVLRDETERPECVEVGAARLVGPHRDRILEQVVCLLTNREEYERMSSAPNPFGDGLAGQRIAEKIVDHLAESPAT